MHNSGFHVLPMKDGKIIMFTSKGNNIVSPGLCVCKEEDGLRSI